MLYPTLCRSFLFRRRLLCQTVQAYSTRTKGKLSTDRYNFNPEVSFTSDPGEHASYPLVTAKELRSLHEPPVQVRMLVRDFIEDSLYNPNYGYFPKRATIVSAPEEATYNFNQMRDSDEFMAHVTRHYAAHGQDRATGPGKQLWATPTEMFKPYYGHAIAESIVASYKPKLFPYDDLIIYEIGAGNGTLAANILDFLQSEYPEVYERTQYRIIEISERMVERQRARLQHAHPTVQIVHESIFHWTKKEHAPCYFLALEVVDNFAHDIVRYDLKTMEPYQGLIAIDQDNAFHQLYSKVSDSLVQDYLDLRSQLGHAPPINRILRSSSTLRTFYANLPFAPNLSTPEYIPTRLLNLLRTLRTYFPQHRLLLSDFSSLPETIPGINAPVVQTRLGGVTVPTQSLLVKQGFFDIFFPTNFERLRDMYERIISQPATPLKGNLPQYEYFTSLDRRMGGGPMWQADLANIYSHADFLKECGELDKTRLKNGENPMIDFYKNVKVLF